MNSLINRIGLIPDIFIASYYFIMFLLYISFLLDSQIKQETDTEEKPLAPTKHRKPDLSCPIAVRDHTEIIINGKKCVLMLNPETNEMCAYPLLPPEGKLRIQSKDVFSLKMYSV